MYVGMSDSYSLVLIAELVAVEVAAPTHAQCNGYVVLMLLFADSCFLGGFRMVGWWVGSWLLDVGSWGGRGVLAVCWRLSKTTLKSVEREEKTCTKRAVYFVPFVRQTNPPQVLLRGEQVNLGTTRHVSYFKSPWWPKAMSAESKSLEQYRYNQTLNEVVMTFLRRSN